MGVTGKKKETIVHFGLERKVSSTVFKLQNSHTVIMFKSNNTSTIIALLLHTLWHRASPNEWCHRYMALFVSMTLYFLYVLSTNNWKKIIIMIKTWHHGKQPDHRWVSNLKNMSIHHEKLQPAVFLKKKKKSCVSIVVMISFSMQQRSEATANSWH